MKRQIALLLTLMLMASVLYVPARADEKDVVIDSRNVEFPMDATITGDLEITGDCPETIILINVQVEGAIEVDADHPVTIRMQGNSSCAQMELDSQTTVIGGKIGELTMDTILSYVEAAQITKATVEKTGGVLHLEDTTVGTLVLEKSNSLAGGKGCQVQNLIKNDNRIRFSGSWENLQENFNPEKQTETVWNNRGVEGMLVLNRNLYSPERNVVKATLTITKVPEGMKGDYRLYWYIGSTFSGCTWHVDLEEGATFEWTCSVHFDGVMTELPVWAELTDNDDSDIKVRFVQPVKIDYTTEQYNDLEYDGDVFPYEIHLLRNQNVVIIYGLDEHGKYTKVVNAFVCSVGLHNPTPLGTYEINLQYRWGPLMGDLYGQYESQFNGNMLFHSVPYRSLEPNNIEWDEYAYLGEPASSGCVRLAVADARWIFNHCRKGTQVQIYESEELPVEKPVPIVIQEDSRHRGWCPTDPNPDNPTRAKNPPRVDDYFAKRERHKKPLPVLN